MSPAILFLAAVVGAPPMGIPLSPPAQAQAVSPSNDAPAAQAPATKTFSYPDLNIKVDVPLSWTYQDVGGTVIEVTDWHRDRIFFIRAYPYSGRIFSADQLEAVMEPRLLANGYVVSARQRVKLSGVDCLEINATKDMGRKSTSSSTYFLGDGQNLFLIQLMKKIEGKAEADDELNSILKSFNFISPPAPPASTIPATSTHAGYGDEVD